jgi:hypothetical protein
MPRILFTHKCFVSEIVSGRVDQIEESSEEIEAMEGN